MSISKYSRKDFLAIKKLPSNFKFMVNSWREMTTQYGDGIFLVGEVIKTPTELKKDGPTKGQIRISPTTASSFEKLGLVEWEQLERKIVEFQFDDEVGTILAIDVLKWSGESIVRNDEQEKPTKSEA